MNAREDTVAAVKFESLRVRIERFFVENPDEELTYAILCVKFDCSRSAVEHAVQMLRNAGVIEALHVIRNRQKGIAK